MDKLDGNLPVGITDDDWNSMHREWHAEKDRYISKLKEAHDSAKIVYSRIDLLLKFCGNLPLMFKKATPSEKKQLISLMTRTLIYDGEILSVELKPAFENMRVLAKIENGASEGNRTLVYRNHNPRP
jgi:hypothetical protein